MAKSKKCEEFEVDDEIGLINALWQILKEHESNKVERVLQYLDKRNDDRPYFEYDEEED